MSDLVACPFCRQLFEPGEASTCPDCGLGLKDLGKLPPSYDAKVEYPEEPIPPHMETLPWTYTGRNRALLLILAAAGLAWFVKTDPAHAGARRAAEPRMNEETR